MRVTQEARTASFLAVMGSTGADHADQRHRQRLWLLFWLGAPMFMGLLLGWAQAGSARLLDRGPAVLYVMSGVVPSWWLYGLIAAGLRRFVPRLPLTLVLLLAPCLAAFLLRPIYVGRKALFGIPHIDADYPGLEAPFAMLASYLYGNLLGIICFPIIALFFYSLLRIDVLRWITHIGASANAGAPQSATLPSGVLARLPLRLGTDVQALVAAEHYLRVITASGEAMVLYRLGDAIRDMELAGIKGIQVHRSYWVATSAIAGHSRDGSRMTLNLVGGLAVPVSRSYRQALKVSTGL